MGEFDDDVPLPPKPGPSGTGTATVTVKRPRPKKPPPHIHTKSSAGKIILLALLGAALLFGIGYAAGQTMRGGSTEAAQSPGPEDCELVPVAPQYPPASDFNVLVLNAGSPAGSATTTAEQLSSYGFGISGIDNGSTQGIETPNVIQHGPDAAAAVPLLEAYLVGGVTVQEFPDAGASLTLLLQPNFTGLASAEEAQAILSEPVLTPVGPGCPVEQAPAGA